MDSLSAGDRAQLHELYARSVVLPELGRLNEWVELFEPQAVLRSLQADAGRIAEHRFTGREELLRLGEQIAGSQFDIAVGEFARTTRLRHVIGNVCLFEEGMHHASGIAQIVVISIGAGEPRWIASGSYADRLTKSSAGCWRFQSRMYTADDVSAASPGQTPYAGLSRLAAHS